MKSTLACFLATLATAPVAAGVLDGSITGDGYGLSAVQTVETQFGDNFSELNAAYTRVDAGTLYLAITGNIEANFNKLNIFIHTGAAGGQNTIGPDVNNGGVNPANDGWAINYSGVGEGNNNGPGFTFDDGFAANYLAIIRRGNGNQFDFDFSSVGDASVEEVSGDIFSGTITGANASVGASGIGVAYDDSNTAGILGGTGAADTAAALAVQTGLELAIPLGAIGNPDPSDILISAMVNGSNHDFLSNQILGGYAAPQSNLGGDGGGNFNNDVAAIDLGQFAGTQHFGVVPEPASGVLVLFAIAAGLRRR